MMRPCGHWQASAVSCVCGAGPLLASPERTRDDPPMTLEPGLWRALLVTRVIAPRERLEADPLFEGL